MDAAGPSGVQTIDRAIRVGAPSDDLQVARAVAQARQDQVALGAKRDAAGVARAGRPDALQGGAVGAGSPLNEFEVTAAVANRRDEAIAQPGAEAEKPERDFTHCTGGPSATPRRHPRCRKRPHLDLQIALQITM